MKQRVPYLWIIWLSALGIHGLLLMIPLSPTFDRPASKTEQAKVRVVNLGNSAKPSLDKESSVVNSPRSLKVATPQKKVPKPTPSPISKAATQEPKAKQTPIATNVLKPPASQATAARSPKPTPPISKNDLVVDLSRLPNTAPCKNVDSCWRTETSQWRTVHTGVEAQLLAQGYQVKKLELEEDTGFLIYQISKNGITQHYLHLISTLEGTISVLNPTQLSKAEVEQKLEPSSGVAG